PAANLLQAPVIEIVQPHSIALERHVRDQRTAAESRADHSARRPVRSNHRGVLPTRTLRSRVGRVNAGDRRVRAGDPRRALISSLPSSRDVLPPSSSPTSPSPPPHPPPPPPLHPPD